LNFLKKSSQADDFPLLIAHSLLPSFDVRSISLLIFLDDEKQRTDLSPQLSNQPFQMLLFLPN
jgi:hypothetical protein